MSVLDLGPGLVLGAAGCFVLGAVVALLVLGVVMQRIEKRGRWAKADAALEAWRSQRRRDRVDERAAWQRDFAALLPRPEPVPCDGSDHQHVDDYRIGSREVRVICVPRSAGGVVLSPGEQVVSQREIADRLGRGGITVEQAVEAMRRLAR